MPERPRLLRSERILVAVTVVLAAAAGATHFAKAGAIAPFVVAALALAAIAALMGRSVDHLAERVRPGTAGVLQSGLANLPELFFGLFALHAGLVGVVRSALVGSVLANVLLVMGTAFVAGGLRHGTQRFEAPPARDATLLLLLAVAILTVPTLSSHLAVPVAHHEETLSDVAAVVLLVVFAGSIVYGIRQRAAEPAPGPAPGSAWSVPLLVVMLVGSAALAAAVSDWFVDSLRPALDVLHITQGFAGLVIVAIAGNAVEHVVGVRLMLQNRPELALPVLLQSPVQVAVGLFPVLVLISPALGPVHLTLVLPILLVVALAIASLVAVLVVYDGESTWLEGVALLGLYAAIATAFWWG